MLKENQLIKVVWGGKNKKHYTDLGYLFTKIGESFDVKAEDLMPWSKQKVVVICDHCGKEISRMYYDYLSEHDAEFGDTCKACSKIKWARTNQERYGSPWFVQTSDFKDKRNETMLERYGTIHAFQNEECYNKFTQTMQDRFGVSHALQSEELMQKNKETCLEHFGVEFSLQAEEVKAKSKQTCLDKYGYESTALVPEFIAKRLNSMYQNGTCATSKPQLQVYDMLNDVYGNCELNYPCDRCSLDCMVNVDGTLIDVEYDGQYWHQDREEEDSRRDIFVSSQGYKILRIKAAKGLPSKEQLINAIDYLVKDNHSYNEIILDI